MKYCYKCGHELVDEAVVCTACGCAQQNTPAVKDESSVGYAFLGFCIPMAGLILYLVWKDQTPLRAKSAGKGALISVILLAVFYILYAIFFAFLIVNTSMCY